MDIEQREETKGIISNILSFVNKSVPVDALEHISDSLHLFLSGRSLPKQRTKHKSQWASGQNNTEGSPRYRFFFQERLLLDLFCSFLGLLGLFEFVFSFFVNFFFWKGRRTIKEARSVTKRSRY
jgi:hypothetical protein